MGGRCGAQERVGDGEGSLVVEGDRPDCGRRTRSVSSCGWPGGRDGRRQGRASDEGGPVELYNPGAILPGIVGAISLILAFYSLQTLPINYAGVLLILLGIVLFILEIKVTSYGLLTLGGIASMVLGALLLVKTDAPFLKVSLSVIIPTVVTFGALLMIVVWMAVKAQLRRPVTGSEGMVGSVAVAKTDLAPRGKVFLQGEIWDAVSEEPLREGEEAEVKAVAGLTLTVRPHRK
ncbi:MAG: hypothetical protein E6K64_01225 [Nitrospirae bacterium]|nr:MAG: hypothetical protein E6K64_01225 [Nitrospirota bacterium]